MNAAKAELLQAFDGTDNGDLTSFCGVEVKTNEGDKLKYGILLGQVDEEIQCARQ